MELAHSIALVAIFVALVWLVRTGRSATKQRANARRRALQSLGLPVEDRNRKRSVRDERLSSVARKSGKNLNN